MTDYEKVILNDRTMGISVSEISKEEISVLADVAMFRIAAISGYSLPTSKEFAEILNEEFIMQLTNYGFDNLTFDEIVSAFRINANGIKYPAGGEHKRIISYGGFFNMNYAAQVLSNYKELRAALDRKIENAINGHDGDDNAKYIISKYENYQK